MCEYCGCKEVPAVRALIDEHVDLLERAAVIRTVLREGAASAEIAEFIRLLHAHVGREERGLFTALRDAGEFVEEVDALEQEHVDLNELIAALDPTDADYATRLGVLFEDLAQHVEREELGIFPVAIVSLGADGWRTVELA